MEQHDARREPAMSAKWPGPAGHGSLLSELRHLYGANKHLHTALTVMAAGPHPPAVGYQAAHYLSSGYAVAAARARALGYPAVAAQLDQCVTDATSLGLRASPPGEVVSDRDSASRNHDARP